MGAHDPIEKIRQRAYEIWESEGRPAGRDRAHWLQAEAELQQSAKRAKSQQASSPAKSRKTKNPASSRKSRKKGPRKGSKDRANR